MYSFCVISNIFDTSLFSQVKYRFLSIDKGNDFVTIYDNWFTKVSDKQFDYLAASFDLFAQLKENFDDSAGRYYNFFVGDESFSVIDVWDDSFNQYIDFVKKD